MITWAETNDPDLINKVENGLNTTYRKGTNGWHEFEQWKANGGIPAPYDAFTPARDSKLGEMKQACESAIVSTYPIWKQINILNGMINQATGSPYTEQDISDMKVHIEAQRAKCSAKESQIAQAQTVEQVQAISWG